MSSRIDIHQQQIHSIMENSANHANMDDFALLALQMEAQSTKNDLKKEVPPPPTASKMKIRAIQYGDLKPGPNSFVPPPSNLKSQEVQKDTKKDSKVSSVTAPAMLDEKLPDSDDRAFFEAQMHLQEIQSDSDEKLPDSDAIGTDFAPTSRQMDLYKYQHDSFHGLNHIRKANRQRLIEIAHSRALELSKMTKRQADKDLLYSIARGVLAIIGVTQPDNIQKLLMGVGEALGQLSFVQKTSLEAKKTPIQTQLDLLKGAEIPQLDEEQRNYARMVQELDACIQRLREMEMNTMHSIHQG